MQSKWGIRKIANALGLVKMKKNGFNCDDTLQHVMRALDDDLSEEEQKAFLDHMNTCSKCLEKYRIEQSFKKFLSEKIAHHPVPENLTTQIRTAIRNFKDA